MKSFLKNIINKGVDFENGQNNSKILVTTNFILLAASLLAFARFIFFLYSSLPIFYLISLFSSILFFLIYLANTKGYYTFAKFALIVIGNAATCSKELISGGTSSQIYLILASYGVVFLLFNVRDYWKIVIALSIPTLNSVIVLFYPNLLYSTPYVSLEVLNFEKYVGVFSNVLISVAIIWYFVKQSNTIEEKLSDANIQLTTEINLKEIAEKETEQAKELLSKSLDREIELNNFRNTLIAKVTHEYKNPLTIINYAISLLEQHYKKRNDEMFQDVIWRVEQSIDQLNSGMNNLLAYSKLENYEIEITYVELDIILEIKSIIKDLKFFDKLNKFDFILNCKQDEYFIKTDPNLIFQIIQNLLQNAVKYSPNGGTITIDVASLENNLILSVSDQGIGISEEDLKLLAKPFKRGKNVEGIKGTGIGLAIVKSWTELLKGKLEITSQLGVGSKFTATLPKS